MIVIEERFSSLANKIGQVSNMIKDFIKDNPPEFLNMSFKVNLIIDNKDYCFIISQENSSFEKGHNKFTEFKVIASSKFWLDVFDGNYTFFGGYAEGLVEIPNFKPHRYKVFLISGLISMLLNMNMNF
ncbi:MAG: hypothetical protein EAX96_16385 [Candidatus Lokiarchaeota archaeon]|nr:hypothetical protein [Candidatus Lokiarchaeota archaeon]